ncbi:flagellar biosynthetic protein FliO [Roseibium salinum]|nr:flagellar biosynthetic protein FliO [Roseibium salinum]
MYNWIETTFNVSGGVTQVIAVLLALAAVLLLFGLFIFILRRLMGSDPQQNRSRQPRIAVMDSAAVDTKRRLILIRRDNIEHLILVGGPSDVVVEQNIIRHAPLGSARPGTMAQAGVPGQVKSPVAPGPDLPPRPDEWAAATETAPPPPAVQARPPSPAPRPAAAASPSAPAATSAPARAPAAPSAPAPTATAPVAPAAPRQPAMEKARINPFAAKPPQTDAKPATASLDVRPDPKPEPAGSTGRAADLLRAATQNGFNRTVSKPQSPAVPPVADMAAGAEKAHQAPEVKVEPAPVREEATPAASDTASPFKSLTRPFSPRERPSYGGYSITPPASGPAARAKTALLKPVEAEQPAHKIEPVLPAAPAPAAPPPATGAAGRNRPDCTGCSGRAPRGCRRGSGGTGNRRRGRS